MATEILENRARTRLERELRDINGNPSTTNVSFGPVTDGDIFHCQAIIIGPVGTPLDGVLFHLSIHFPPDYPFKPPKVKFQTKVYHPNIGEDGTIYIDMLGDQWSSALTTEKLLLSICSILPDPIVNVNPNPISNIYRHGKNCYNKKARGLIKQRLLRCWSRIKYSVTKLKNAAAAKPGKGENISYLV